MSQALQTLWQEVVAAALVGTDRRPFVPPSRGDRLGTLLAGLDGSDPNRTLLVAAGTIATYRRAGRPAATALPTLPEPCGLDDLPPCRPASIQHLKQMLGGEHDEVLPEWLDALVARGQRVPEECLVPLLESGLAQTDRRDRIVPALGRRGRWLAAQNPDWVPFLAGIGDEEAGRSVEDVWQTGTQVERLALLGRLRASAPAQARSLVESTWASDPLPTRVQFLSAFATGLSLEDEPFLETALDDRRKEIRSEAADLLARLSGSGLVARMTERLLPRLTLAVGKARAPKKGLKATIARGVRKVTGAGASEASPTLEANVPDECDKAMTRDGVEPKPNTNGKIPKLSGLGEKAWWLYQMVCAVPPSVWTAKFGLSPSALIEAAEGSDWTLLLTMGWAVSTRRFRDVEWAEALLEHAPTAGWTEPREVEVLADVLTADRLEAIALTLLRKHSGPLGAEHPSLPVLRACRHSWSPELARAVLNQVKLTLETGKAYVHWHLTELFPRFARSIPPELAAEAASGWPTSKDDAWNYWSSYVDRMLLLLQFRHEMLTELAR